MGVTSLRTLVDIYWKILKGLVEGRTPDYEPYPKTALQPQRQLQQGQGRGTWHATNLSCWAVEVFWASVVRRSPGFSVTLSRHPAVWCNLLSRTVAAVVDKSVKRAVIVVGENCYSILLFREKVLRWWQSAYSYFSQAAWLECLLDSVSLLYRAIRLVANTEVRLENDDWIDSGMNCNYRNHWNYILTAF